MKTYQLLITLFLASLLTKIAQAATPLAKPGCQSSCGDLTIPFPFGTTQGCYLQDNINSFKLTCINNTHLYLGSENIDYHRVANISLNGEIKIVSFVARACFNGSGGQTDVKTASLFHRKFNVSYKRNKFTAVGCSTTAVIEGETPERLYVTGCLASCYTVDDPKNGSCSGVACCQSSIPEGVRDYRASITYPSIRSGYNPVMDTFPCSYAFLVEDDSYSFSSTDLLGLAGGDSRFPVVLDWSVGDKSCDETMRNVSNYACVASNSFCINADNGTGYRCNCSSGYEGNPYLVNGCEDTNECLSNSNPCAVEAKCENYIGSFSCSCPNGYEGDGKREGSGCTKKSTKKSQTLAIVLGVGMSFLASMLVTCLVYFLLAKRKLMKQREIFFQQNGGFMLTEQLSKQNRSIETARIFTAEDLKSATNNYDKSRIIGQGGFGTVYKGILSPNGKEVAIKKSKISDQSQIEQFINEVIILSQINHRNVVNLLGCCLETEVPMLVYEFISNGTVSDHVHDRDMSTPSLSWEMRLKVAAEAAGAIAYLHSATSTPIIHRDIKSTNILLDENYTAKVADFGASKLVPLDQTQLTTLVQGTFGYLDPEYFHSSQLTEKSDVYSFGVLLAELITGQKALSFARAEKDRCLATYFVSSVQSDHGVIHIVDNTLVVEGNTHQQVKDVALLAARCLRLKGEERPSMKEVAMELEGLKKTVEHPWSNKDLNLDNKETEYLLKNSLALEGYGVVSDESSSYSSMGGFSMSRKVQLR